MLSASRVLSLTIVGEGRVPVIADTAGKYSCAEHVTADSVYVRLQGSGGRDVNVNVYWSAA